MNKTYDYLIVGAGIYGATFACMAHRQGNAIIWGAIFIVKTLKVSMCTNMVRIFFIPPIKKFGILLTRLLNSTVIPILLSLITKANNITCLSI